MLMTNAPPKHVKVTFYMPPDQLADVDGHRAELRRLGINVDRGRMIRAALTLAAGHSDEWVQRLKEDE